MSLNQAEKNVLEAADKWEYRTDNTTTATLRSAVHEMRRLGKAVIKPTISNDVAEALWDEATQTVIGVDSGGTHCRNASRFGCMTYALGLDQKNKRERWKNVASFLREWADALESREGV